MARRPVAPHHQGGQAQFIERPVPLTHSDNRFSQVLEWITGHLEQEHSIDSLAWRAAMSRRNFTRHFRQATGTSVKQWLLNQRLAHAQRILESSDASIEVIANRLHGRLADTFTGSQLKQNYGLTTTQLNAVLGRIAEEGWAEKKPGYGWEFSPMLTTLDSLLQSYRLRLALEPAALLEPGYKLDPRVAERCRAAELHLLNGGIETDTADQLHERGVRFHEALVEASGNRFFIDAIRRVNRVRRLLSYRSTQDRSRYKQHCKQHLHIIDLLEQERNEEASQALAEHLQSTLKNISKIKKILSSSE